jgi:LysR family transcriptional regulator, glycine cleavage system transcriptional activator
MHSKRYQVPPLDLLPAFEAAARNLSFTQAAQELFLTQSAVSRQIKGLEEHLGCALFERRTRALRLTEAGQDLYRVTADVLERLHQAAAKLQSGQAARLLALTTTPGFASLWLIPRLQRLLARHPQIDVRIAATNDVLNLERSLIDLAIRYSAPEAAPAGAISLFGEDVFPVCRPELLRDPSRPLARPRDLEHHVLLHLDYPAGRGSWLDWGTWLAALGVADLKPAAALHFTQYDQMIQATVAGQGVALGRSPLVGQLIRSGQLAAPFDRTAVVPRAYYLIESALAANKPQVKAFVAWLLQEAASEAMGDSGS